MHDAVITVFRFTEGLVEGAQRHKDLKGERQNGGVGRGFMVNQGESK
jgi:hypothetical protein